MKYLRNIFLVLSRYQWSVGLTSNDVPTGIFQKELERVWHDAGQNNFIVFSVKPGMLCFYPFYVFAFNFLLCYTQLFVMHVLYPYRISFARRH